MTRRTTTAALAARQIRKMLKQHGVKASVKSSNYAGGNSIRVTLFDAPPWTVDAVKAATAKYEYGTFDGMTDSYNYDNRRDDIPQVKYLFVEVEFTDERRQSVWEWLRANYAEWADAPESLEEARMARTSGAGGGSVYSTDAVHQALHGAIY